MKRWKILGKDKKTYIIEGNEIGGYMPEWGEAGEYQILEEQDISAEVKAKQDAIDLRLKKKADARAELRPLKGVPMTTLTEVRRRQDLIMDALDLDAEDINTTIVRQDIETPKPNRSN